MEMRLMTTGSERELFGQRVTEARARHGGIFREVLGMRFDNRARLASASLYALFENESDSVEKMLAGIAMHNLQIFPQSCSEPDLGHLPPRIGPRVQRSLVAFERCGDAGLAWRRNSGCTTPSLRGSRLPGRRIIGPYGILLRDGVRQGGKAGRIPIRRNARRGQTASAACDSGRQSIAETNYRRLSA